MKIALVCHFYPPNRTSCAVQMRDLACELLSLGHEPIVYVPGDNIYSGSNFSVIDGVQVCQLASFKFTQVSVLRRGIAELLMPFTMLLSLFGTRFSSSKVDLVIWYSPSIFFGPFVWFLKVRSSCKGYLILRDIFPEWLLDLGLIKKGPVYYFFKCVAQLQYSVADKIGVQSSSNVDYFYESVYSNYKKIHVLNNWLSEKRDDIGSPLTAESIFPGRKVFVYIGNMGIAQDMTILIDLAEHLQNDKRVGFLFVGRGTEKNKLEKRAKEMSLSNVFFHEEIDPKYIPKLLKGCTVGLVALHPDHQSHNIPGKFLSYLQAGLPVLARINTHTDLEYIILNEELGEVYSGYDAEAFSLQALKFIENEFNCESISRKSKAFFNKNYTASSAAKRILNSLFNNF